MFILDEFDLFAKPFKQTVLYNLLDALQTSSVQVRHSSSYQYFEGFWHSCLIRHMQTSRLRCLWNLCCQTCILDRLGFSTRLAAFTGHRFMSNGTHDVRKLSALPEGSYLHTCCAWIQTACAVCIESVLYVQAAVVAISARFNVMDSMEKRVRSRFSHRRDIILELPAEDFDSPDSGPVALLQSFLSLPVSFPLPCIAV